MLSSPRLLLLRSSRAACRLYHVSAISSKEKIALVLGSSGTLGSAVSRQLTRQGARVIGADIVEGNTLLDGFVPLPHPSQQPSLGEVTTCLTEGVGQVLEENEGNLLHVIVVASGGWEGDPQITSDDPMGAATAYGDAIDRMMRMNLHPVVAAGYVAQAYMDTKGLFIVIGATAALSPTPGMVGYGLSKTAAHHYVQTMGSITELALISKSQRKQAKQSRSSNEALDEMTVVGILPTKIDTPSNRKSEPDADFGTWTKPEHIAKEIGVWMDEPHLRPHSGSLVKVYATADGGAKFQLAR